MKGPQFPFVTVCRPDVIQMTYLFDPAEMGVFIRLYMALYDHPEGLPDDDRLLMRLANCSLKVWKRVRPIVLQKFTRVKHDDGLFYLTLECVLRDVLKITERSSNAKTKILKRWKRDDTAVIPQHNRGITNSLTPERSDKLQPPVQPPAREEPPPTAGEEPEGGSSDKSDGEEMVVVNGRVMPKRIGNTVLDEEMGRYVPLPPKPVKRPKVEATLPASTSPAFDVMAMLDDAAIAAVRRAAPGWDIYQLASVYNANIAAGTHAAPRNAKTAFPAWCGRYTAGRAPGAERPRRAA